MGQLQRFHYNEINNCKQATLISQFPKGSHIMMRPFYKLFFWFIFHQLLRRWLMFSQVLLHKPFDTPKTYINNVAIKSGTCKPLD